MPATCKWCLCELEEYARPGGECANCWEIRSRCDLNPRVGLLIAMSIGQEFLLKMIAEHWLQQKKEASNGMDKSSTSDG